MLISSRRPHNFGYCPFAISYAINIRVCQYGSGRGTRPGCRVTAKVMCLNLTLTLTLTLPEQKTATPFPSSLARRAEKGPVWACNDRSHRVLCSHATVGPRSGAARAEDVGRTLPRQLPGTKKRQLLSHLLWPA